MEALVRRRQDANRLQRVGLEVQGKRIAREGSGVVRDNLPIGRVTSGTFSPTLNKAIAMAYVDPSIQTAGTTVQVDIRGSLEPATVVALPFYRRTKE